MGSVYNFNTSWDHAGFPIQMDNGVVGGMHDGCVGDAAGVVNALNCPIQYLFEHLLAWLTPQHLWKILMESSFARFTGRGGVPGAGFSRQRCKF